MRILFSTEPASGIFNHLSVVRELAARGHEVTVAVHRRRDDEGVLDLLAKTTNVELVDAPPPPPDRWVALESDVRSSIDVLTFFEGRYNDTYRARSRRRAPRALLRLLPLLRRQPLRGLARRALAQLEHAIPADAQLEAWFAAQRPDVVLFTPYVGLRTSQVHFLRAARALGLRTAIAVKSWDNLSSKSSLRPLPDRVFVWNEFQRREAETLHGVPSERVVVTGAQCFDPWLALEPTPRELFAQRIGLDPAGPIVLYTCCAPWTKQSELPFVRRWLEALRASEDETLRTAGVLVRPHPKRPQEVRRSDLEDLGAVAVWPGHVAPPVAGEAQQAYFDSLVHSGAVVGLNTTAMLEASLVGRPVFTVLDPEFRAVQEGTLHFRYMREVAGGFVRAADTLDVHLRQLAAGLREGDDGRSAAFAAAFLRPHGLRTAATGVFVDAVEALGALPRPEPPRRSPLERPLRTLAAPLARRAARGAV